MGEYVNFLGRDIKIGTLESLYYVTFFKMLVAYKAGTLAYVPGNLPPSDYLKPNSGFRFRFPFPDEDKVPLGELGRPDFDRGLAIWVDDPWFVAESASKQGGNGLYHVEIVQQKLVNRKSDNKLILALVLHDRSGKGRYRIEDEEEVKGFLKQLVRWNILPESDPDRKVMLRQVAIRLLKGYRLNISNTLEVDQPPRIVKEIKPRNGLSK